eukprot:11487742-Alexandrium_andersonii.AAC.1
MCQAFGGRRAEAEAAGKIRGPLLVLASWDPLGGDLLLGFTVLRNNAQEGGVPVSYTHLTLPTICSV